MNPESITVGQLVAYPENGGEPIRIDGVKSIRFDEENPSYDLGEKDFTGVSVLNLNNAGFTAWCNCDIEANEFIRMVFWGKAKPKTKITKKRFKKLMMSIGYNRDDVEYLCNCVAVNNGLISYNDLIPSIVKKG